MGRPPFADNAPSVSPWKPWTVETTRERPRRGAPELQRCLGRLGPRARKEHAGQPRGRAPEQLLREQTRQERHPELHRARVLELERLDERGPHAGVVATDVEHPEAAEDVEVAPALRVVHVLALGPRPDTVEADRAQHAHELRLMVRP